MINASIKDNLAIKQLVPPFHSGEYSYSESLKLRLDTYIWFIKEALNPPSYILNKINTLNEIIISSLETFKSARAQEAYSAICDFIKSEKNNLNFPIYEFSRTNPLVRLRYSESDLEDRKDIFHIPFSQRHQVSQQRYSISGVPCLYLSGCAFTAWLELNKPNFSNLWCSAFRSKQNIKLFDLSIRLDQILTEKDYFDKLLIYPLVIATSYAAKYPKSPFKEEYIISNILLQAILGFSDINGIRYCSTKISNYKPEYIWMASNVVLPAKEPSNDYDSNLMSNLELTYPQPCSVLIHSPNIGGVSCMGANMTEHVEYLNNELLHSEAKIFDIYPVTQFFNIDGYLRNELKFGTINETF